MAPAAPQPAGRLLSVVLGNASTALGVVAPGERGGEVVRHWTLSSDERRTADEWAVLVRGLVGPHLDEVEGVAVAATVPWVLGRWREMLERHLPDLPVVVVGAGVRTGIPVLTDNPREVGADRVVNALAALTRWGGPAVVVDVGGTAVTLEVVNAAGQYVGGAIAPGVEVGLEGLGRRAAQLRQVELVRPRSVVARNTVEAVQSGLVHGTAAMVEGLVRRALAEQDLDPATTRVVATGAYAGLVADEAGCFTDVEPHLTLLGLGLVFARNHR
ncbi:type III pantothenate kinase [Nocardioides bruguierae]|uniref:type III pantothenate kinase n=1 Tax=Nocardioides bruguierae TaxID=2945102 RepID=UPI00202146BB|nr:type III pantothenate kinase [Nocardioides bruguierae]MCL8026193.1 type III pantothenate kinase [Nocardioides bruguierae]